jgi:hypothetical protein
MFQFLLADHQKINITKGIASKGGRWKELLVGLIIIEDWIGF